VLLLGGGLAAPARAAPLPKRAKPLAVTAPTGLSGPPRADLLVIRGGTLLDGNGGPPVPNACVVCRKGRIEAVGPLGRVPVPEGARMLVVPARTTLLPGLIDMHVHTSVHPGLMPYFLANGITTVRDLGCADTRLAELKRYRTDAPVGKQLGPRIFLSGPPLDGFPRSANWFPGPGARDAAAAAAAVTQLAEQGVDLVKLYRRLNPTAARAAIEEAHRRNLPVTWDYQWNYRYLTNAINSGVDGLEHVFYSERASRDEFEQIGELMAARRIWFDPTLVAFRPPDSSVTADVDFSALPPSLTRFWNRLFWPMETDAEFSAMKGFVRLLHRHGVRLLAGSDSPVKYSAPGYALHRELQLLGECGLTPNEVLRCATRSAAEALGRLRDLGTVEVGKLADLVVVDGNPLRDPSATRRVRWVVLNGRVHEPGVLLTEARKGPPTADLQLPPHLHGD
jgi:imidazolonepropionase-like amidohydrolase